MLHASIAEHENDICAKHPHHCQSIHLEIQMYRQKTTANYKVNVK